MNVKRLKESSRMHRLPISASSFMDFLDRSVPVFRTILVGAGVAGAALDIGVTADYLFVAGFLLHFTILFEDWWHAAGVS